MKVSEPEFFDVKYVINPHMAEHVGTVDYARALDEWHALKESYEEIGLSVHAVEGKPGLPDMVFCANQTLPFQLPNEGRNGVVLSEMVAD